MELSKKTVAQMFGSVVGIIVIAFGVSLVVKASVGIDPWGVFFNAMREVYMTYKLSSMPTLTLGDSITIVNIFIVVISSLLVKEKIKWLSIVGGIVLGQFVNVWSFLLTNITFGQINVELFGSTFNLIGYILLVLGIVVISFGIAITIHFPLVLSPVDYLAYALDKVVSPISYGVLRVISDISIAVLGMVIVLLVTGDFSRTRVGVGTILMFLVTGLVIDKMQQWLGRVI